MILGAGLVAIGAAIALAVLALAGGDRRRKAAFDLVLAHGPGGVLDGGAEGADAARAPAAPTRVALRRALLDAVGRLAARGAVAPRVRTALDRAALGWSVEEWLLLVVGAAIAGAAVFALLLGPGGVLVGLAAGVLAPRVYLSVAASRRGRRFSSDLPDALQLVASGLASGYSLPQALDAVVSLGDGPVAVEVGRALAVARLGTSVEDALAAAAERVGSKDLAWVVMAVRIQRDVGGNLSGVLLSVAATIRERASLRRHVAALAAEGKLSGYILGILPLGLAGFMWIVQPDYVALLVTRPLGLVMIAVGAVLLAVGAWWMRAIVRIEL